MVLPQLFGEVELDLAQHGLITDLDRALDTRTWHYVRSAINRLLDSDQGSWLKKEVMALVRKRNARSGLDRVPHSGSRGGGVPAGS